LKEVFNDYNTGYIVDFIFGREMLADDKETALVKYAYAYQEIKKLIQEGKIEYEKGIFGVFEALFWNATNIEEITENLELIGVLS
jgi:hypothetical protein